jgi:anthranilate synthase/aminodeoxychorismate synthase-like glutamine amidotransferase
MILLIDNYDSFVFNLARYFERLGVETRVVRNDAIGVAEIRALRPAAVVLSPGPCTPSEAGSSLEIVREMYTELPILGVCLGHQTIAAALGGNVVRATAPMHGQSSQIEHSGRGLFENLPSPLRVGRYHSLIVEQTNLSKALTVTATTEDGVIMAFEHAQYPVFGVQFHPESILTEHGYHLLANFLRAANIMPPSGTPSMSSELTAPTKTPAPLPSRPVTF